MAKVPNDIVEGIKRLSEASGIPVKSLIERLGHIKNTNENIKTMEKEDFKIRFAWSILLKETTSSGSEYYIMPTCYPRIRETTSKGEKTKVADITALIQKITKNEEGKTLLGPVQYGSGTFWRDAAGNLKIAEPEKVYKASLIPKENSWGVSITSNNTSIVPFEFKMKSFNDFFEAEIKPLNALITIEEMDIHKSETTTDIKIIKGTITEADIRERPDGSQYGYYDITDESVIGTKTQRIFVDPKDVIFEQGSVVLFGGTIRIDEENGRPMWTHQFQIPTESVMKKEIKQKTAQPKEEALEIDLDSEELEGKEIEEEKKGEELNFEV